MNKQRNIVFDNFVFVCQRAGGVSIVWHELINKIGRTKKYDILFLDYKGSANNIFSDISGFNFKTILFPNGFHNFLRFKDPKLKLPFKYIFHSSLYRTSKDKNAVNIVTVHDFTYELFRKGLAKWVNHYRKWKSIKRSEVVVCISENTKKDLLKFFPQFKDKDIRVVYNGVSDDYFPLKAVPYPELKDYFLFVGARGLYKNFDFAVEMAAKTGKKLFIVGTPLNQSETFLLEEKLKNNYKSAANINNSELNKIYNSVFALVYPSSYEGFGIPVIEAEKAACPVIALDASSVAEIIGEGYPMMKALDESQFLKVYDNIKKNRETIIQLGLENSKRFSWQTMAKGYEQIYDYIFKKF